MGEVTVIVKTDTHRLTQRTVYANLKAVGASVQCCTYLEPYLSARSPTIITVFELPPKQGASSRVSLLSRYGICACLCEGSERDNTASERFIFKRKRQLTSSLRTLHDNVPSLWALKRQFVPAQQCLVR